MLNLISFLFSFAPKLLKNIVFIHKSHARAVKKNADRLVPLPAWGQSASNKWKPAHRGCDLGLHEYGPAGLAACVFSRWSGLRQSHVQQV